MASLLQTLLQLQDEIHELRKQLYKLEHEGQEQEHELYLQSAIENAKFELRMLQSNLNNYFTPP